MHNDTLLPLPQVGILGVVVYQNAREMLEEILYTRVHFFTQYILLECDSPHVETEDRYIDCINVLRLLYCSTSV